LGDYRRTLCELAKDFGMPARTTDRSMGGYVAVGATPKASEKTRAMVRGLTEIA
jgi:hypothetical protein